MEIRIHELLNGYEDSSVPMEETDQGADRNED